MTAPSSECSACAKACCSPALSLTNLVICVCDLRASEASPKIAGAFSCRAGVAESTSPLASVPGNSARSAVELWRAFCYAQRIMLKRLALAVFVLFAANIAVDSLDAACLFENEPSCHACLCATPSAPADAAIGKSVEPRGHLHRGYQSPVFAGRLADKSFFQPPKAV